MSLESTSSYLHTGDVERTAAISSSPLEEQARQQTPVPNSPAASTKNEIETGPSGRAGDASGTGLPPVDTGRHAWTFCASAFALETFVWGFNNTYGVFQDYYSSHQPFQNASPVALSAIGTTALGIQYIEIIFVIILCQRYPEFIKPAMWVTLLCSSLSIFISSFANQVWQLVLLQGVLYGINAGIMYAPVVIWLPQWFVARRGLAGGLIFGGSGFGGLVFPLFIGELLARVGFRWTLRIWATILLVGGGVSLLGANPRLPVPKGSSPESRASLIPRGLPMWKSPLLYCVAMTTACQALSFFPVALYIPTYTSSVSSHLSATVVLAVFNAASAVAFILYGHLSDLHPYSLIIIASSVGSALAAFTLWGFATSLGFVFAFAALFGGLSGGFPGIWAAAATEVAGERPEQIGLIFGVFSIAKGGAVIVGPTIAGSLFQKGRDRSLYGSFGFKGVELFVGTMAIVTALGGVSVAATRGRGSTFFRWLHKD